MRDVPEVNSAWLPDAVRQYHYVDISFGAQGPDGSTVHPVIADADRAGLKDLAASRADLSAKAAAGTLEGTEASAGTFTVVNLGRFGVKQASAIVRPPQSCVLTLGTVQRRAIPAANGGVKPTYAMTCTLSCDHRTVDGAVGAAWLQAFKTYLEDPDTMLL